LACVLESGSKRGSWVVVKMVVLEGIARELYNGRVYALTALGVLLPSEGALHRADSVKYIIIKSQNSIIHSPGYI